MEEWVGEWAGTYWLWLEPNDPGRECATSATVRPVMGGRFLTMDYEWSVDGDPAWGHMLIGPAARQLAWADSWHNSDSIMYCTPTPAAADGDAFDVLGSYGPPEEPWGWRTTIELRGSELVVTAFNITPQGQEVKATEAVYRRA